jgi:hypothetical protein
MTIEPRYNRHARFFAEEGQERIGSTRVAVVGVGGLGSHVVQQLAYLGVRHFVLVDNDRVSLSNLNRLIGATDADIDELKTVVASGLISSIQPSAKVDRVDEGFDADEPLAALGDMNIVFGCVDGDVPRVGLMEYCFPRGVPYVDLATDILPEGEYGGRVVFADDGKRCLSCHDELDQHELARARMTLEQRAADDGIYGVTRDALGEVGPSVVSINGAVASLAVTEFVVWRTGLRAPAGYLNYRADRGTVGKRTDPSRDYCYYCSELWSTTGSQ